MTKKTRWRKQDINFLLKNYEKMPIEKITKKLRKTIHSIYKKANRLTINFQNNKFCLRCKKIIKKKYGRKSKTKKFCNDMCRARFHATKRYERLKDNPEYKKKAGARTKKWISENRGRFNDLVREKSRLYQIKLRKERKEKGVCRKCGGEIDDKRFIWCSKCRQKSRQNYRKMREKLGYKPIR